MLRYCTYYTLSLLLRHLLYKRLTHKTVINIQSAKLLQAPYNMTSHQMLNLQINYWNNKVGIHICLETLIIHSFVKNMYSYNLYILQFNLHLKGDCKTYPHNVKLVNF